MTLPKDVQDARGELDAAHDQRFAPWRNQWQIIHAHLLSQEAEIADYKNASLHAADDCIAKDAEIARLNRLLESMTNLAVKKDSQIKIAESRLAAANALLRDIKDWDVNQAQGAYLMVPLNLRKRIQAHLSENTHDRA